jgi:diguanylate cyclase (GGDEF)-like protein
LQHSNVDWGQEKRSTSALAFVDLDGLKSTNDRFGHAAGDELLRRTVDTIRTQLRSHDLIVRFGGDEFVCVLLDVNLSEASRRFETIRAELAKNQGGSIKVIRGDSIAS